MMRNLLMFAGAAALAATSPAIAQPGHAKGHKNPTAGQQHRGQACPPGLARQGTGCLPPGQAKKIFDVGQRVPTGYGYMPYNRIPVNVRDRYGLNDDYRYIYRDQHLYVVDPTTRLVTNIINAIL